VGAVADESGIAGRAPNLGSGPFGRTSLDHTIRLWVEDVRERMQCCPDYIAVSLMAALGSIIGRKVTVRLQREDDWTEVPNQWALCIGRPGLMKSPAIEEALGPLKMLAATAREKFKLAMAEHEVRSATTAVRAKHAKREAGRLLDRDSSALIEDLLSAKCVYGAPTHKRYIATNASVEALGEILQQNAQGIVVHRDELIG